MSAAPDPDLPPVPEAIVLTRPTGVRWLVFSLACGTSWLLYFHRYTFGLVKPFLVDEWGISKTELGEVDRVFALCYMVFQVPAGFLADMIGTRFFLAACISIWSGALYSQTLVSNTYGLSWSLGILGMSQAGVYPSLSKVSRIWFPISIRTTVQGWIGVFFGRLGASSTNLILMSLAVGMMHLPWQKAVQISAVMGLVLAAVFLWFFRDTPRTHPRANLAEIELIEGSARIDAPGAAVVERPSLWILIRSRRGLNLLCLTLQTFLSTMADQFYVSWLVLFFSDTYEPGAIMLGVVASMPLIGGAFGGVAGGMLNDRLLKWGVSRRMSRSAVGMTGKGIAGLLIAFGALGLMNNMYLMCACLVLVKFFSDWSLASTWGTVTDVGGRYSATVFAFNNGLASLAPFVIARTLGVIADYGWRELLLFVGAIYIACAFSWLLVNAERDLFPESTNPA
ncbi:MAG: MFS transporter [Planctomycetaceae bacterium]